MVNTIISCKLIICYSSKKINATFQCVKKSFNILMDVKIITTLTLHLYLYI